MRRSDHAAVPTDAEVDVLRVLWERGPSTVREVHREIGPSRKVGYTTILKQMQVMHAKGMLRRSERFRSHLYSLREPRATTQGRLARSLLSRVFGGSASELLQSALGSRRIDDAELNRIRTVLEEIARRQP
jgi:BlaI family transcriptional regulator, penicillinase repressor